MSFGFLRPSPASPIEARQAADELLEGVTKSHRIADPEGLTWTWTSNSALFARQHLGKVSFGLRLPKALSGGVHTRAGQDPRPEYLLTGALPSWTQRDVQTLCQELGWNATPQRPLTGGRSWIVKSQEAPPRHSFPVSSGHERTTIAIRVNERRN
eukprot:397876-Amphidinium_carterae.1